MGPLPDAKTLRRQADTLDTEIQSRDSVEPSANWACVDDFYRSLAKTDHSSHQLDSAKPVNEESDWWDFLEGKTDSTFHFE